MKIEKLNDNQIRATLTREDLESRNIRLSEFAYGTEAARILFSDLLKFASYKLGFEVDDSPLMVEAIPISDDSIILIVTKIVFPEEMDTRFARFSDAPIDGMDFLSTTDYSPSEILVGDSSIKATEILDEEKSESEEDVSSNDDSQPESTDTEAISPKRYTRLFVFSTIDDAFDASKQLKDAYKGENVLYHTKDGYALVAHIGEHTTAEFNRIVNILSEYADMRTFPQGLDHYFKEHDKPIIEHNALQTLALL